MAVSVKSGDLRHTVQFKQPALSQNEEGGTIKIFSVYLETKAAVKQANSFRSGSPEALQDTKEFTVRWTEDRAAINKDFLIGYNGTDYTINSIEQVNELQRWIKFTAKARTNG